MKKYFEKEHVLGIFTFVCLMVAIFGILYLPKLNHKEIETELKEKFAWLEEYDSEIDQIVRWRAYEFPRESSKYGLGLDYYFGATQRNKLVVRLSCWQQEEIESIEITILFEGRPNECRSGLIENGKLNLSREGKFILKWLREQGVFDKLGLEARIQGILKEVS